MSQGSKNLQSLMGYSFSFFGWKVFEVTGTSAGQEMGLALLSFVGKLIVVGFGMTKNEYMISKLMAFDAEIIGTWGCLRWCLRARYR